MTLPSLRIIEIAAAAETRLRTAIAAANANGAPESALKGVYIPIHEFEVVPAAKWPLLKIMFESDGGDGVSAHLPLINEVGTLSFDCLVGGGRLDSATLRLKAGQIARAIIDTLLEDTTFLEMFAEVTRCVAMFAPVKAGDDATMYDTVMFWIELEMNLGQWSFTAAIPADAGRKTLDFKVAGLGDPDVTINPRTPVPVREQLDET